ncbi:MAG: sigma-70 family RNA polymerase sigma factor [Luteitalea sp.]|nr:sigma-70 family RNA polymerase sigma factor [Luteitalea sp.]
MAAEDRSLRRRDFERPHELLDLGRVGHACANAFEDLVLRRHFPTGRHVHQSTGCVTAVTDAELVGRARHGDAAAFAALVERHGRAVYRAVLAALPDAAEADDVAQEAWVTVHRRLASFRGEASFRTWLLAIAWRKALDRRRSVRRWLRVVVTGADDAFDGSRAGRVAANSRGHIAPASSPEQLLLAAEQETVVRKLIRSLPRRLRDPLLMAGTRDATYEEIATVLDIPVGTLKWRVSEARKVLREKLARLGYGR